MIEINISEQEAKQVEYFRYNYPDPLIQRRFEVIWLKFLGYQHKEIAKIANVHHDTVTDYLKMYNEGGCDRLQLTHYRRPVGILDNHTESIKNDLVKNHPQTINEAVVRIELLTGIKRKATQVRMFMKKLGFKQLKCGDVPAKADLGKQQKFLDESLNPRLEAAKAGKRVVLFMDSAHFVHAVFIGFLWCLSRVFIRSASGRSRFNVLGAIDAVSQQLFTICNETYINANSICEMLRQLASHYAEIPITIILDNARYQKCKIVTALASELGIELLYLPPYSPNLNMIERLWKFVKAEVLYCKYYPTFADFKENINKCLNEVNSTKRKKVASLLSLKFHIPIAEEAMVA
jgi:transposase